MNLELIFANKPLLDLALSISGLPVEAPERRALLARAGLGEAAERAFLRSVSTFEALRQSADCASCDACLDENTLAEFVDGVLTANEVVAVERALAQCGNCLRNAVALAQITHELTPAAPWKEVVLNIARRGLRIAAAPLEGFSELALQPVASLSAATETTRARCWSLDDNGVVATFTVTLEEGGMIAMAMTFERDGHAVRGGRIALRAEDLLVEVRPLGRLEEQHTFWHIEPGQYLVEIILPDTTEARFPITIESDCGE